MLCQQIMTPFETIFGRRGGREEGGRGEGVNKKNKKGLFGRKGGRVGGGGGERNLSNGIGREFEVH